MRYLKKGILWKDISEKKSGSWNRAVPRNKKILMISAGCALCLAWNPMHVFAEGASVLQSAGVTTVLQTKLSAEEYIELAQQAQGAAWGYTNIGIADVKGNLNVREEPSLEGKLVGKMPKDSVCEVLESADGWAHVVSGEVEGYVSLDYLMTGPDAKLRAGELVHTIAVVDADALNVRDQPDLEGAVLTKVTRGDELEYVETLDGWIKVLIDDMEAYVSADYVNIVDKLPTAITMTELMYGIGVSDVRVELVEYAKQFLGNPYVWGGTSLTKGADCSGFVLSIFNKFGVYLPRVSASQADSGTKISESELQPGDLIFYANGSGTINHVALYIGNGQVIHASSPTAGIRIDRYGYRTPARFRRVLKD